MFGGPTDLIRIVDTSLREGEQSPGVYLPPELKLEIAIALDAVGVDIIEIGNPMAHPSIAAAIRKVAAAGLRARVAGHARCRIPDVDATLECGVGFLGVFLSVSEKRLMLDYSISLSQAIDRIQKTMHHAKTQRPDLMLRFTPEDAVRSPFENVVNASAAAVEAGADVISVSDTTGLMLPVAGERNLGHYVQRLKAALAERGLHPLIAAHCHNDRGVALANALQACAIGGAEVVDATVLGLGERAGIVDLAQLLTNLSEWPGYEQRWKLDKLPALYQAYAHHTHRLIPHNAPIVGAYAFTNFLGVHPRGECFGRTVPTEREEAPPDLEVQPARFGRDWGTALGVQTGRPSLELALDHIGRGDLKAYPELVDTILHEVKAAVIGGDSVEILNKFLAIVWRCEKQWKARKQAAPSTDEYSDDALLVG